MGRPIKIAESSTIDSGYASGLGGVGGEPFSTIGVHTIDVQYKTAANATVANGYIVNQRSSNRFVVGNSAAVGSDITTVTLVNSGDIANMAASTASITCYNTSNVAFYAKRISSKHVWDWNDVKYVYHTNAVANATYANVAVS